MYLKHCVCEYPSLYTRHRVLRSLTTNFHFPHLLADVHVLKPMSNYYITRNSHMPPYTIVYIVCGQTCIVCIEWDCQ